MDLLEAMRRADYLARLGLGLTSPNPIVGAVILDSDGRKIGEGFHQRTAGGIHAEVNAIKAAGSMTRGATLVLTLEPCNHQGNTPPCVEAIIEAGIARVVYAVSDPNPIASGGAARLRAAGISVEAGLLQDEISFSNRAWLTKIAKNRPYITLKIAATMDGKVAANDGTSKWITSESARRDSAVLRSECDAIITGTGTAIADNPKLTVREVTRDGVDSHFAPERVVMGERDINLDGFTKLQSRELSELISLASKKGWNRILVEAGPTLTSAFLRSRNFDEIFLYQAPTILGGGMNFASELGIQSLVDRLDLDLREAKVIPGEIDNLRIHLMARSS